MTAYRLFGAETSPYSIKVRSFLRYKGVDFEWIGRSKATEEEFVWRLPPSLAGTEEGSEERAAYQAVGESNRMTLKFRKPE